MQFKHPEILYALLLLIIPIIVHLFQLQRFVKVPFTNVKFLKKIEQQTRKSARLKKWLILFIRMLAFASLILAFAQPYFGEYSAKQYFKTTIYLDNSYSMQAKGENGELLKLNAQKIIENIGTNKNEVSVITNHQNFENLDAKSLKNELINLKYHPNHLNLNSVLLQLNNQKTTKTNTLYKNILISDFQNINIINKSLFTNVNFPVSLIKTTPKNNENFFIDSVYISKNTLAEITLNTIVKSTKNNNESLPVSLFENTVLMGKATAKFSNSNKTTVQFTIPNSINFNGKISLADDNLAFDNDFYFSISKPEKINVLSIGENASFLAKIYTENEFNFTSSPLQNLNYNNIEKQQLIVLNEIENIPTELINTLVPFCKNGGSLVVIPSGRIDINSYNRLLNSLGADSINSKIEQEHTITTIHFNHPLLNDVFEKSVQNFQYPKTTLFYSTQPNKNSTILSLDNNLPFISSKAITNGYFYFITSPLNKNVSNFLQSPLIVPVFYNFGKQSLNISQLYYTIAPEIDVDIKTSIGKDEILTISKNNSTFIPLQNISQNKVTLQFENNILESGFYSVLNRNEELKTLAFNYNRKESYLNYAPIDSLASKNKNITISSNIDDVFEKISDQQKINWLFKWFLAFSALFLLLEMLILKYFKI